MTTPHRIQLRRAKGWRMPENTVKVDRTTRWGNPFIVGKHGTRAECVRLYALLLTGKVALIRDPHPNQQAAYLERYLCHRETLRGRNLACWCRLCEEHRDGKPVGVECPDCAPCHADVLLVAANTDEGES